MKSCPESRADIIFTNTPVYYIRVPCTFHKIINDTKGTSISDYTGVSRISHVAARWVFSYNNIFGRTTFTIYGETENSTAKRYTGEY